ncbi:MAG: hypothetical protein AAFN43_12815, partial [Pseudomonadota bacterium]
MPFSASKIAEFGCLIGLMALLTFLAPTRAEAQFTIEIGISRDKAVKLCNLACTKRHPAPL